MSNQEYDSLYDELSALENKTGVILAGSPTADVGYEAGGELPKVLALLVMTSPISPFPLVTAFSSLPSR